MLQKYKDIKFNRKTVDLINTMNGVLDEYARQGFVLTVRQLYYQLVARDVIENTVRSYKNTASAVNDARIAGRMDWNMIEDRTREFVKRSRWEDGGSIVRDCASQFHMDMWANQKARVFAIVEKEALAGVLSGVCNSLDIPLLAARGYPSVTVLREFALDDLRQAIRAKQHIVLLHLGDHDPSGIDMSRDLTERLAMFTGGQLFDFTRIALNMDQVKQYNPPPNPAKTTDSRFESYMRQFGDESWELDALAPQVLVALIERNARAFIDEEAWEAREQEIEVIKTRLDQVADTL